MSDVPCAGCGELIPGVGNYVGEDEEARHVGCLEPLEPQTEGVDRLHADMRRRRLEERMAVRDERTGRRLYVRKGDDAA